MKFSANIEKTDNGMVIRPLYSSDAEQMQKLKQNTEYRFDVKQARNVDFHRKFFALIKLGFENQEEYNNIEHYRKIITMKAGFYETIETLKGTVYLPTSISFDSLDQTTFEELFSRVLDVIANELDTAPQDIRNELNSFM